MKLYLQSTCLFTVRCFLKHKNGSSFFLLSWTHLRIAILQSNILTARFQHFSLRSHIFFYFFVYFLFLSFLSFFVFIFLPNFFSISFHLLCALSVLYLFHCAAFRPKSIRYTHTHTRSFDKHTQHSAANLADDVCYATGITTRTSLR
jgi:Ca2+/Na+ antiporter